MPVIADFAGLKKITRKQKGVYVLWGKDNECLYVGVGMVLARLSCHLTPRSEFHNLIDSITVYPGKSDRELSVLEYALIRRFSPIYNKESRWNNVVGRKYDNCAHSFFLKKKSGLE